jgi:hypothetical protein
MSADRIAGARTVSLENELTRRGHHLRREGRELIGPCPLCGGTDRFGVNLSKQVWHCRGCGVGGDVIALVRHLDGVRFAEAVALLNNSPQQPIIHSAHRDDDRQRTDIARSIWARRQPITRSTPVWGYLKGRGLDPSKLPPTLGYLPPSAKYPDHCMVAAFGLAVETEPGVLAVPPDIVQAVHLTRLTGSGEKIGEKAKIMVGSPKAAPIILAPVNDLLGLAVTEGIEDGLSVHQATGLGVWVAGSAPHMPALAGRIPDYVECCTIYMHDDDGRRYALQLAEALSARDIEVLIEGERV